MNRPTAVTPANVGGQLRVDASLSKRWKRRDWVVGGLSPNLPWLMAAGIGGGSTRIWTVEFRNEINCWRASNPRSVSASPLTATARTGVSYLGNYTHRRRSVYWQRTDTPVSDGHTIGQTSAVWRGGDSLRAVIWTRLGPPRLRRCTCNRKSLNDREHRPSTRLSPTLFRSLVRSGENHQPK
jgi:hypothetical protein